MKIAALDGKFTAILTNLREKSTMEYLRNTMMLMEQDSMINKVGFKEMKTKILSHHKQI